MSEKRKYNYWNFLKPRMWLKVYHLTMAELHPNGFWHDIHKYAKEEWERKHKKKKEEDEEGMLV